MMQQVSSTAAPMPASFEPFVAPETVAAYLCITRRAVLDLARSGRLNGHPLRTGQRKQWRFRLSEVAEDIGNRDTVDDGDSRKETVQ